MYSCLRACPSLSDAWSRRYWLAQAAASKPVQAENKTEPVVASKTAQAAASKTGQARNKIAQVRSTSEQALTAARCSPSRCYRTAQG
jgi:hypothetical protein